MNLTCCPAIHMHTLAAMPVEYLMAGPDRFSLLHQRCWANNSTFDITELKFSHVYTSAS